MTGRGKDAVAENFGNIYTCREYCHLCSLKRNESGNVWINGNL